MSKTASLMRVAGVAAACAMASARPVRAQPTAPSSAEAESLFRDGQRLMKEQWYDEACTAFEGSHRLDPDATTLMNLAKCRELKGQLATSWSLYLEAASMLRGDASQQAVADSARSLAVALEPRLSHLIINVPDQSRVDGLTIQRNGNTVDPATWNRSIPIDGGRYVIVARIPDHEPWSAEVVVANEYDKQSVDVPRFASRQPAESVVAPAKTPALDPAPAEVVSPREEDDPELAPTGDHGRRTRLTIAASVGGVGLIAIGGAAYFGLSAKSRWQEAKDAGCADDGACPTSAALDVANDAKAKATTATIATGVGVAAVATAAVLWFTAPDANVPLVEPTDDGEGASVVFRGSF